MIALSPRETWEYVLKQDRESDKPTTFRLRPLTLRDRNEAEDLCSPAVAGARGIGMGTFNTKVLRGGLVGWSGLFDGAGAEVRFGVDRDGKVREDLLERLPSAASAELADEILSRSTISSADRKNS